MKFRPFPPLHEERHASFSPSRQCVANEDGLFKNLYVITLSGSETGAGMRSATSLFQGSVSGPSRGLKQALVTAPEHTLSITLAHLITHIPQDRFPTFPFPPCLPMILSPGTLDSRRAPRSSPRKHSSGHVWCADLQSNGAWPGAPCPVRGCWLPRSLGSSSAENLSELCCMELWRRPACSAL